MLLKGLNHVAVITNDATRLNDFYRDVFDAERVEALVVGTSVPASRDFR